MKIPTTATFIRNAARGEYTTTDIEAIILAIEERRKSLHNQLEKLEELEELAKIIATTRLAKSVDSENIQAAKKAAMAGIIMESDNSVDSMKSTKVM